MSSRDTLMIASC